MAAANSWTQHQLLIPFHLANIPILFHALNFLVQHVQQALTKAYSNLICIFIPHHMPVQMLTQTTSHVNNMPQVKLYTRVTASNN
jgi:hypothetical protein